MRAKSFLSLVMLAALSAPPLAAQEQERMVVVETSAGSMKFKLYNDTPGHRDNFIRLAREGQYDGTLFYRVVKEFMIQGGSRVNKDVPPYVKAGRDPLSYAGINSIGLRRRSFTNEQINDIQNIYRYVYLSGMNTSHALERIEAELPATKERDEILLFIRNSPRGIIKGYFE